MSEMNGYVNLAHSGELIFGVGSIHHLPLRRQRIKLLRQALDIGFRKFDVAPAYGNGLNELELGIALNGFSDKCTISTKFGIPSDLYGARHPHTFFLLRGLHRLCDKNYGDEYKYRIFNGDEMELSIESSLKRLKRDYIDNLLIHEPIGFLQDAELMDIHNKASRLKEQGKILGWGVAGPATSIAQFENDPLIDVFQFPLADLAKVVVSPLQRKIVYGVYRYYKSSLSEQNRTFAGFVRDKLNHAGMDLIISSTSTITLKSFRDCFE